MNELKLLPKYKKQWDKKFTTEPLFKDEDNGIYLLIENYDPITHAGTISKKIIRQFAENNCYLFEVFKILKKYHMVKFSPYTAASPMPPWRVEATPAGGQIVASYSPAPRIINGNPLINFKQISIKHLIKKRANQNSFYKNLSNIKSYNDFLNEVFNDIKMNTKITLVIQKKIGYKYYQQIEYK